MIIITIHLVQFDNIIISINYTTHTNTKQHVKRSRSYLLNIDNDAASLGSANVEVTVAGDTAREAARVVHELAIHPHDKGVVDQDLYFVE